MLNSTIYKNMIKFGNETRGIQTKVTKNTLLLGKIVGTIFLSIGILFLIFALAGYKI
jgi:hypothetical protein